MELKYQEGFGEVAIERLAKAILNARVDFLSAVTLGLEE